MNLFDIELSKDLAEINERLQNEKNIDNKNRLLMDKKIILHYLNRIKRKKETCYNKNLNEHEVIEFLKNNQFEQFNLKKIKLLYVNHKKLLKLTHEFIYNDETNLCNIYKSIKKYGGIKVFKTSRSYLGKTIYIKSLNKNYIEIHKQNLVNDYVALIHELGHARMNSLCNTSKLKFVESYPIFLELVFSDFLKKNGHFKESYNIKLSLLKQINNFSLELKNEFGFYVCGNNNMNSLMFEYKYQTLKDITLGFYLYEMYLSNPQESLIKIDYFVLNSSKMSEDQLLDILGIKNLDFNNSSSLLQKNYNKLEYEKNNNKKISRIIKK